MGPAQRPRGSARPRTCCPAPLPRWAPDRFSCRVSPRAPLPPFRDPAAHRCAEDPRGAALGLRLARRAGGAQKCDGGVAAVKRLLDGRCAALRSQLLCAELDAGRAAIAVMASALCAAAGGSLCSELTACMHACTRSHPHARARAHTHMPRMHACAASACTHRCAEDPRGESRVVCAYRFMQQNWNPRVHAVPLIPISPCCEFSVPRSRFVAVPKL